MFARMVMKRIMNARVMDLLMSLFCVGFMGSLIFINMYLSSSMSAKQELSDIAVSAARQHESKRSAVLPSAPKRVRRQVETTSNSNYTTWTLPAENTPITLNIPLSGCDSSTILDTDFPKGTCFANCNSASCSGDDITNIQNGAASLVCTAGVVQLGFKRTGTYSISRWIKANSKVQSKTAMLFKDDFDSCPQPQLADSSQSFYFDPYTVDQIGQDQDTLYLHCEECLTSVTNAEEWFGSAFMTLPLVLMEYLVNPNQKFIITLKNPTDRVIAEYFYPYIRDGTDLSTVGSQTLHTAMANAITQAKACMNLIGPTPCVYGINPFTDGQEILAETTMLYESSYAMHISQFQTIVDSSKIYYMMIEEYSAAPETQIQNLFTFIGLDYEGTVEQPGGTPVHKPILSDTVAMLDAFFSPLNDELSTLLGDDKWKFTRN